MENNDKNKSEQSANSKDYDPNKPQNITKPAFDSTSDHRSTNDLPGVENLDPKIEHDKNSLDNGRLTGNADKPDLGNGERTQEDRDDEKIIEP